MNQKAILIVALRVTALFLLVSALNKVGGMVVVETTLSSYMGVVQEGARLSYPVVIELSLKLMTCIVLWFFPTLLLNKISGLPKEDVYPTAENFLMPLVSLLGLFLLFEGVMGLGNVLLTPNPLEGTDFFVYMIFPLSLHLVVGIWFTFGNSGIVKLIYKLRSTKV